MENMAALQYINQGTINFFTFLGQAAHMELIENDFYTMFRPKPGCSGTSTVYNMQLENLNDEQTRQRIEAIKKQGVHVWWNVDCSDRVYKLVFGRDRQPPDADGAEFSMALLRGDKPEYTFQQDENITVKRAGSPQLFEIWAGMANYICENGTPLVHPTNHYFHCERGEADCYIGYYMGVPAAVLGVFYGAGVASLHLLGTLTDFRRKGLARALCATAVDNAMGKGCKAVVSIVWQSAKPLMDSLGFTAY